MREGHTLGRDVSAPHEGEREMGPSNSVAPTLHTARCTRQTNKKFREKAHATVASSCRQLSQRDLSKGCRHYYVATRKNKNCCWMHYHGQIKYEQVMANKWLFTSSLATVMSAEFHLISIWGQRNLWQQDMQQSKTCTIELCKGCAASILISFVHDITKLKCVSNS